MAKSMSNLLLKGITRLPIAQSSRAASLSFYQKASSGSHDDFMPTNKIENSGHSLKDVVEKDVKENPVMIYMKGGLDFPQCGFSSLAVRVLKLYDVPLNARNILEDSELKNAVKAFSLWPTFPQIFIKGEFIGGSDIVLNMHQNGELKEKLGDISAKQEKSE